MNTVQVTFFKKITIVLKYSSIEESILFTLYFEKEAVGQKTYVNISDVSHGTQITQEHVFLKARGIYPPFVKSAAYKTSSAP